jgi:hypothetical protein
MITDNMIADCVYVLNNYHGIDLPDEVIRQVLESDTELQDEIRDGAATDTYVRDILIGCVCRRLEVSDYPCYGDTHEYAENFWNSMKSALEAVGGKVLNQA